MKKYLEVIVLILALLLTSGCGTEKKEPVNIAMSSDERAVSKEIRKLYADMNESNLNYFIFNLSSGVLDTLTDNLKETMHGATLKEIIVKEIYEFDEFEMYAVAAFYSGGAKEMVVNDLLLISKIDESYYVILQQMYSPSAQSEIIDACKEYSDIYTDIFEACNKKYGIEESVTTVLSVTDTENNFTDSNGKYIYFAGGIVYDFSLSLSDISKGVVGEPSENEENLFDDSAFKPDNTAAPTKIADGRELVWHLEFTTNSISDLSGALNTGVDVMSPDYKTLFVSNGLENYFLDDGNLVLRITKDYKSNAYTTARSVTTVDRMSFKYGYLEMRAIVPYQQYVWPSFWLQPDKKTLSNDFKYYSEIDIFEVFGSSNTAVFNLHKWYDGYAGSDTIGNRGNYTGNLKYVFSERYNLAKEYHLYGFEWTPEYMKAYIDGEFYYQVSIKEEDDYSTEHPGMECFHDYHYICWNNWVYSNEAQGRLETPVDYKIDYVRLYQHKDKEYIKIY